MQVYFMCVSATKYLMILTGKGFKLAKNSLPTLHMPKTTYPTELSVLRKAPVRQGIACVQS